MYTRWLSSRRALTPLWPECCRLKVSCRRKFSGTRAIEPLRILFCGTDRFSNIILKSLHDKLNTSPERIASLEVLCRQAKPSGRGLKQIIASPTATLADSLRLRRHELNDDSFDNWEFPFSDSQPLNLIIAASFGLMIPGGVINKFAHGGLNVHPSILPDFRGPAPLHRTLLARESTTGATVQTLHPEAFDRGTILEQTKLPGFVHDCQTVDALIDKTAAEGAELLMSCIDRGLTPGSVNTQRGGLPGVAKKSRYAGKIHPQDQHIVWSAMTADEILLKHRIIGPLWNEMRVANGDKTVVQRIKWSGGFSLLERPFQEKMAVGVPCVVVNENGKARTFCKTVDQKLLAIDEMVVSGGSVGVPVASVRKARLLHPDIPKDFRHLAGDGVHIFPLISGRLE